MVSSAPEEIAEPSDIAETYDEWLSIYFDSTERKFHLAFVGYAFATEEVRDSSYFRKLGEAVGLPRIEGVDPLASLFLGVIARSEPVMKALQTLEDR
jgi:hypothetical protein